LFPDETSWTNQLKNFAKTRKEFTYEPSNGDNTKLKDAVF